MYSYFHVFHDHILILKYWQQKPPWFFFVFPYVKLLTIKCYDWSNELTNKMCAASVVRMNSANKTNVGSKQTNPTQTIPLMCELL
jgi:hypothetical protein